MVAIPTVIAAIIIHWKDAPNWMFWSVIGFGIFAWVCGKTFLTATHDNEQGKETDINVLRFWRMAANLVIWAQWLICTAAIAFSLIFPNNSPQANMFENSIYYLLKANEISASLPSLQKTTPPKVEEKQKEMISFLKISQKLAERIDEDFLRKLHSQLPIYYKNKLITGQLLYISGLEQDDPAKQMAAVNLLIEWQDYWEVYGQSIITKIENR